MQEGALSAAPVRHEDDQAQVAALLDNVEQVIFGKRETIELCLVGLLARGHLLIEDIPGIGKTTLAHGIARSIDSSFARIQFTSDMLPADILGVSVLDPATNAFQFRPGPIFSNIILADEVNRTPPKTQSALLEAMSEYRVSADGLTRPLPDPFMVLATQNPIEYEGTYPLPEAQLDRFLLRVEIGYPDPGSELRVMRSQDSLRVLARMQPVLHAEDIIRLRAAIKEITVEDSVAQYMLAIVQATREHAGIRLGVSPRGSLALYESCQAFAFVRGRRYATPGDVKQMAVPVLSHRIIVRGHGGAQSTSVREKATAIEEIVAGIPIPR